MEVEERLYYPGFSGCRGVTRVLGWGCKIHYLSSFWVGGVTRVFMPNDHERIKLLSGGEEE